MAITTTLQRKYVFQRLFMLILCLGGGIWGVYDYTVKIPRTEMMFARGQIYQKVKHALDAVPGSDESRSALPEAAKEVEVELRKHLFSGDPKEEVSFEELKSSLENLENDQDKAWAAELLVFGTAIREAGSRGPETPASEAFVAAYQSAKNGVNATADVTKPSRFDRATQWAFMSCLLCVPWLGWTLWRDKGRVFSLDDDGTVHSPAGAWDADSIEDVDMSRWMKKSIAEVVHTDGRRVKLDDYIYKNTDLIVGALASERYPSEWDAEAKRLKTQVATDESASEVDDEEPALHS